MTTQIKERLDKVRIEIELIDEIVTNDLMKHNHASEEFKKGQRISNALLNVERAMSTLNFEL